jgi:hypothetical protein
VIIEEEDFKLEQQENFDRYDLELMYVVNAKDPEKRREEFKNAGYSMSLDTCLNKIVNYRLSKRIDTCNFKDFIKGYKEERKKLENLASLK